MKNVGIHAAMTLAEIGPASDLVVFFNAVTQFLENGKIGSVYPCVTEKLYRRSLKQSELVTTKQQLDSIEDAFSRTSSNGIDWFSLGFDENNTRLNIKQSNLAYIFKRFFSAYSEALECTNAYYQEIKSYIPVRLGFTDAPYYIYDIIRPESEYDALKPDDLPFWLC